MRGTAVGFESALEKDFLAICDFDLSVRRVREQPLKLEVPGSKTERPYVPDFLVDHTSGELWLIEVKYEEDLDRDWAELRPRFNAAVAWARSNGAKFAVATETDIRGPFLKNVLLLRAFRTRTAQPEIEDRLNSVLARLGETTPEALLKAAYPDQDGQSQAVAIMWRLLSVGHFLADLKQPLTMRSRIRIANGEGITWRPRSYHSIRARFSR